MPLVTAMLAGADGIDDTDVLRRDATVRAFAGMRAPSTLGSCLHAFPRGDVCQLRSPAHAFMCRLTGHSGHLAGEQR